MKPHPVLIILAAAAFGLFQSCRTSKHTRDVSVIESRHDTFNLEEFISTTLRQTAHYSANTTTKTVIYDTERVDSTGNHPIRAEIVSTRVEDATTTADKVDSTHTVSEGVSQSTMEIHEAETSEKVANTRHTVWVILLFVVLLTFYLIDSKILKK